MSQVQIEYHRLAFKLSYECGLSSTEVIRLKPEDINLVDGYIKFKKRIIVLPEDFIFNLKLLPISKGGTNDFDNLQTLCKDCNHGKGGKALQTF